MNNNESVWPSPEMEEEIDQAGEEFQEFRNCMFETLRTSYYAWVTPEPGEQPPPYMRTEPPPDTTG